MLVLGDEPGDIPADIPRNPWLVGEELSYPPLDCNEASVGDAGEPHGDDWGLIGETRPSSGPYGDNCKRLKELIPITSQVQGLQ